MDSDREFERVDFGLEGSLPKYPMYASLCFKALGEIVLFVFSLDFRDSRSGFTAHRKTGRWDRISSGQYSEPRFSSGGRNRMLTAGRSVAFCCSVQGTGVFHFASPLQRISASRIPSLDEAKQIDYPDKRWSRFLRPPFLLFTYGNRSVRSKKEKPDRRENAIYPRIILTHSRCFCMQRSERCAASGTTTRRRPRPRPLPARGGRSELNFEIFAPSTNKGKNSRKSSS